MLVYSILASAFFLAFYSNLKLMVEVVLFVELLQWHPLWMSRYFCVGRETPRTMYQNWLLLHL